MSLSDSGLNYVLVILRDLWNLSYKRQQFNKRILLMLYHKILILIKLLTNSFLPSSSPSLWLEVNRAIEKVLSNSVFGLCQAAKNHASERAHICLQSLQSDLAVCNLQACITAQGHSKPFYSQHWPTNLYSIWQRRDISVFMHIAETWVYNSTNAKCNGIQYHKAAQNLNHASMNWKRDAAYKAIFIRIFCFNHHISIFTPLMQTSKSDW